MRDVVAVLDFAAHVLSPGKMPAASAWRFDQRRNYRTRASGVGKGTMLALFADRPVEIIYAQSIVVMRHVQHDFDHAHPHDDWKIRK
jgi:hypothetical protein